MYYTACMVPNGIRVGGGPLKSGSRVPNAMGPLRGHSTKAKGNTRCQVVNKYVQISVRMLRAGSPPLERELPCSLLDPSTPRFVY